MLGGPFLFEIDKNAQKLWKGIFSSLIIDMLDHFKTNSSFIRISFGFDPLFPLLF